MNKKIHLIGADLTNQNGLEYFVSSAFQKLGYTVCETSYRKISKELLEIKINTITDVDFILVIKGEMVNPCIIYSTKVPAILWMQDSIEANQDALNVIRERAWAYKKIYTFDFEEISLYRQWGIKAQWLPLAAFLESHKQIDVDKNIDIGFIGSLAPSRIYLLNKVLSKYPIQFTYSFSDYVETVNKTKINLNIGVLPSGIQQRVFEVLACGGFLFTNEIPKEGRIFEDEIHLVYFNDKNLLSLIQYYLDNPEKRKVIAENGRQEVLKNHTYDHRVKQIIRDIKL